MTTQNCYLCDRTAQAFHPNHGKFISCETCGEYEITEELQHFTLSLFGEKNKYVLSGLCRELKETEQDVPCLTTQNLNELMSRSPVPDMEDINAKLEKLLAAVKRKSDHFGKIVELQRDGDYPLAYAKKRQGILRFHRSACRNEVA